MIVVKITTQQIFEMLNKTSQEKKEHNEERGKNKNK